MLSNDRTRKQSTVSLQEQIERDVITHMEVRQSIVHGFDVAQNLVSRYVDGTSTHSLRHFRPKKATRAYPQSFDSRRCDCLGAHEDTRKRLGIDQRGCVLVQSGDCCFGIGHVRRNVSIELETPTR
jgi:hypothetical protein